MGKGVIARMAAGGLLAALLVTAFPDPRPAFAALPFLTDDAETLGKGTSQVELWYVGSTDKETAGGSAVRTCQHLPGATFGYGVAETLDLTLGFTRLWGKVTVDGLSSDDAGSAVSTLSAKWRFLENAGFQLAVKPLVGYSHKLGSTGDDPTVSFGGWLLVSRAHETLEVSLNAGFLYNDYGSAAERDAGRSGIWIFSALAEYEVTPELNLGLDVGASSNPDKTSGGMPAYALAGAAYSLNKRVELSLGLKFGITKPEPDFAGTAGITFRF